LASCDGVGELSDAISTTNDLIWDPSGGGGAFRELIGASSALSDRQAMAPERSTT
jgi:hypothetical protein